MSVRPIEGLHLPGEAGGAGPTRTLQTTPTLEATGEKFEVN